MTAPRHTRAGRAKGNSGSFAVFLPLIVCIIGGLTVTIIAVVSATTAGNPLLRNELRRGFENAAMAAAAPDPQEVDEFFNDLALRYGRQQTLTATQSIARNDDQLRLVAVFFLHGRMPPAEFDAFAQSVLSPQEYEHVKSHITPTN